MAAVHHSLAHLPFPRIFIDSLSFHLDLCLDISITLKIYLCQSMITEVSFFAIMSQYSQT